MANYLDANPDEAEHVGGARWGKFVPIVKHGHIIALVNPHSLDKLVPETITAEDYVVGLEVLGYTFEVVADPKRGHLLGEYDPTAPCPKGWHAHALALMQAMARDRTGEVIAFLIERDGVAGDGR